MVGVQIVVVRRYILPVREHEGRRERGYLRSSTRAVKSSCSALLRAR